MNLVFNAYLIVLLVSGVLAALLALLTYKKHNNTSNLFSLNMLCSAWWAIFYSFELASDSLPAMLFWVKMQYIGITALPLTWVIFIASFTGKNEWLTKKNLLALATVPVLTLILAWTNNWHHLHYQNAVQDTINGVSLLDITPGIWYHIFTVYFYVILAAGIFLLLRTFKKHDRIFNRQKITIIIAAFMPWIANFLYLSGLRPFQHIDITPYSFIFSSLIIKFGLLKFRLFDLVPLAREKVVEAMRDGVLVADEHGRVIDVNAQMLKVVGVNKPSKIVGTGLNELFAGNDLLLGEIETRKNCTLEIEFNRHESKYFYQADVNHLYEKNKVYTGLVLLLHDITSHRKSEELLAEQAHELKLLNKQKDRLFSIIAHDLRSPVTNLKLMVDMIDNGMITSGEFKQFLPELSKKVNYTTSLLENLLHWSKSQLQGEQIEAVRFDLKAVADNEIKYFTEKAEEKGIILRDTIPGGKPAFADMNMIELVIRNILSNAIKFSREGHVITISVDEESRSHYTVCIEDTGIGIRPEHLTKLFELDAFSTRGTNNEPGTGLGLQLCKEFVEKNNGTIWAESEPGLGTRIFFTLPVYIPVPVTACI